MLSANLKLLQRPFSPFESLSTCYPNLGCFDKVQENVQIKFSVNLVA